MSRDDELSLRERLSRWIESRRDSVSDGIPTPSDRAIERIVRVLILLAVAIANLIGTVAVFVLSVWVLPTREVAGDGPPIIINLAMAGGYILVAVPVGVAWTTRRLRPGRQWLREERHPSAAEQLNLLRAPAHVLLVVGALWLLAAVVFGTFNATYSWELAQRVAITVALGGLVTCATAYLLTERLLRPAAARALAARALEDPALPGVTVRSLFAWGIGSGIPLLGLLLIGLSALTEGDFDRDQLAIAVLGLAGGALLLGFWATLLAARVTSAPINSVRQGLAEIEQGDLETEVPVYDGTEFGLLQSGFNRMADGLRERERIRELFGIHVGESVAREALEGEVELGGEQRRVAILFVDMVGSTKIASSRPAPEVVELLNEFFGVVVEVIDAHDGWVNKFEGDAALAVFGAPERIEDPAGRALAAGRALSARLAEEIEGVGAGIGISYGEVVAGNIGSDQRLEYTVIGDAVNEAARLTDLAKSRPGRLLASMRAVEAAGAEAENWRPDETVELRGRPEPTRTALCVSALEGESKSGSSETDPEGEGRPAQTTG